MKDFHFQKRDLSRGSSLINNFIQMTANSCSNDCILWPFAKNSSGYGIVSVNGKTSVASRQILLLSCGQPPSYDCRYVLHSPNACTTKSCVNPKHLRWGSALHNAWDREVEQGRLGLDETGKHSLLTQGNGNSTPENRNVPRHSVKKRQNDAK